MGSSLPPYVIFLAVILTAGKCAKELNHKIWRERIAIQRRSALNGGCEGMFSTASHCWSFDEAQNNKTPDKKGGSPAILQNGARIADSLARGKVASTIKEGSWIDLGNFEGKCISDPDKCPDGITMMFWAKIERMNVFPDPSVPKFIFSSGGSDHNSRGFSFFHQNGMYVLEVANSLKKWRKSILHTKIPYNSWFSFAFTWDKENGLTYFVNGRKESFKVQPTDLALPRANNIHEFTISKPNNNNDAKKHMLPMKIDKFVTWPRVLEPNEIREAFIEGGGLPNNVPQVAQNLRACLPKNPCLNGGACKIDVDEPEGYHCDCLPMYAGLICEQKLTLSDSEGSQDTDGIQHDSTPTPTPTPTPTATPSQTATPVSTAPTKNVTASPAPLVPAVPEQTSADLVAAINRFRRLHCSPGVLVSEKLNTLANKWATTIAALGEAKKDNSSTYGQLICKYSGEDSIVTACVSKWYSCITDFDWAEPKLSDLSSPFTQMVWKSNKEVGVGFAKGNGGEVYVVVLLEPGQNGTGKVRDNVLPATGISQPAPEATCPEGFSAMLGGRSCFSVVNTPSCWYDALMSCVKKNGTLASIESRDEEFFVVDLLKKSNISEAWIGLKDDLKEARYFWVDGSPIPFSEWVQGEPSGYEKENCIVQTTGNVLPGWADKNCFDPKPFICKQPLPGYTTYKMLFNLTEAPPNQQNFQWPAANIMCTTYVQSGNSLLQQAIINYFQAKSMTVQPTVNTVRCMPNGVSTVEVTLSLGPKVPPDMIASFERGIKENGGIKLSSGGSAKLGSVEFVCSGPSSCPNHCGGTSCQPGCNPSCCTQSPTQQFPAPQRAYQPQLNAMTPPFAGASSCPNHCGGASCKPGCNPSCCKQSPTQQFPAPQPAYQPQLNAMTPPFAGASSCPNHCGGASCKPGCNPRCCQQSTTQQSSSSHVSYQPKSNAIKLHFSVTAFCPSNCRGAACQPGCNPRCCTPSTAQQIVTQPQLNAIKPHFSGASSCPTHCQGSSCQSGCNPSCCMQSTNQQSPAPQMVTQPQPNSMKAHFSGASSCPTHCQGSSCQSGCNPSCCMQSTNQQSPAPQMVTQPQPNAMKPHFSGASSCPTHCQGSSCQSGCNPSCCMQSTNQQSPAPQMVTQPQPNAMKAHFSGASSCPNHCQGASCQPRCDPSCCSQSTSQQFPGSQMVTQPQPNAIKPHFSGASSCSNHCGGPSCPPGCNPSCCTQSANQQSTAPRLVTQPNSNAMSPGNCPLSCTRSSKYCPPYCSSRCCKRRSHIRLHTF